MNHDEHTEPGKQRQALSALMDGDGGAADAALRAWRDDASLRADWHAYHLIGELMRSDDVHCEPRRDALFLSALRERLVLEPAALEPAAVEHVATPLLASKQRRAWVAPMAIAAGFAAVAGVLVVTRVAAPDGAAQERAGLLAGRSATAPASAVLTATDGGLIRNAELDRYLAAHRQYSNTSALTAPGGFVRNAAAAAPGR